MAISSTQIMIVSLYALKVNCKTPFLSIKLPSENYNKSITAIEGFAQQAHDVRMTSDRRLCDVMTSHQR